MKVVTLPEDLHEPTEKEIVIYFSNGNKAKFKVGNVVFGHAKRDPSDIFTEDHGKIYVNLNTVCFIREWDEEPKYDE